MTIDKYSPKRKHCCFLFLGLRGASFERRGAGGLCTPGPQLLILIGPERFRNPRVDNSVTNKFLPERILRGVNSETMVCRSQLRQGRRALEPRKYSNRTVASVPRDSLIWGTHAQECCRSLERRFASFGTFVWSVEIVTSFLQRCLIELQAMRHGPSVL